MNIMTVSGHKAKIEYDPEMDMFRGEILGLNGGADFYGKNTDELREEFKKSLDVFLQVCKEKNIEPYKKYSGEFNLRISPELHQKISEWAIAEEKSLNQWISETLEQMVMAEKSEKTRSA
ncbi:type II toxin-antitoxin system HicB family antitoxin [Desulfonema magnum]|uniref:Toxin-antitoxin system, antitoxin component HigB domain-containing protein n=1 Tax=Desulfonema magnum TaxID=45655 RepID=A0A975BFX6_9BACT|nr:type II toxin-antitoxin system HicB family antitoxin [Desulfonema magnum]QTA84772.1 Toxin-antitoxin system, antitoxin component HigB domain-containing protein [Desulfonema magnum]